MDMKNICINIIIIIFVWTPAMCQQIIPLSFRDYIEKVIGGNLEYAAERLNLNVSEAELVAAKVFNDPNLSVSYYNNENKALQMGEGFEFELSKTFTFGKRSAGINLARSEKELTIALLDDYLRNLRADATIAYLEALKQLELYQVKQDSYRHFRQLATSDSIRFALGKIMEIDATQSRLEAGILHNELLQSEVDLHNAFANLNLLTGCLAKDTLFCPEATLHLAPQSFILSELLAAATENRADITAALKNKEIASRALTVARRERNTDIDLSLGVSKNARVRNDEAPAPPFTGITAGVSIPLKFSNFNKGNINVARFREQQAEILYQQALLQVQTEVLQSFRRYQTLTEQVQHYESLLLNEAREVIDGKRYGYARGETSLLEVLTAQHTYNEVQSQYIETLFNHSAALVELERSAGIWDMEM
jgi:cobalt-zinc-cadmium efflux system outer membrane protein